MNTHTHYSTLLLRLTGIAAIVCTAVVSYAANPTHGLAIAAGENRIEVSRATPGGDVLLIGYELAVRDYAPAYRRVQYRETAGADGSFAVERTVAARSLWVAFDLASGAYGGASRGTRSLRQAEIPERALKRNANGKLEKLAPRLDYVYALAIRPGVGTWELTAGDGGAGDDDGALDGKIEIAPRRLKKTGTTAVDLDEFREGDLIVVFAPHQMGYLIKEVRK